MEGRDGDLYGTSPQGGKDNNSQGTVFKISAVDGKLSILHNFHVTDGQVQAAVNYYVVDLNARAVTGI